MITSRHDKESTIFFSSILTTTCSLQDIAFGLQEVFYESVFSLVPRLCITGFVLSLTDDGNMCVILAISDGRWVQAGIEYFVQTP